MKTTISRLGSLWAVLICLSGCFLPSRSVMPATNIICYVHDATTSRPIPNASLSMVYTGPNGHVVKEGPFFTDQGGSGRIEVKKRGIWMSGIDAYFVGRYQRHIEVSAYGYESSGYWENYQRGLLEQKSPFTFRLVPFRNRFGAVRILTQIKGEHYSVLRIEVLDGPEIGEQIELSFMPTGVGGDLSGKRFYLRKSLATIRNDTIRHKLLAHNFPLLLREGFRDEPFDSEEPNQPVQRTGAGARR